MHRYRAGSVVVALFLGLSCRAAFAVAPEIKDEAKFFTPEAVKKANEMIRQLAPYTGVDHRSKRSPARPGRPGREAG